MVEYSCSKCGKIFKQKSNYLVHTELKKYPCNYNKENQENTQLMSTNEFITQNVSVTENTNEVITQNVSVKNIDNSNKLTSLSLSSKKLKNIIIIDDIKENTKNNILTNDKDNDEYGEIIDDDAIDDLKCKFCDKEYSRKDNLSRHINKFCKAKKHFDEFELLKKKYEDIVEKYEEVLEVLASKNDISTTHSVNNSNNPTNSNNANNSNNTNNGSINSNNVNQKNSNNNITVFQFGKEDYSKIPNQLILKTIMSSTGAGIPCSLIEKLHFNKDYPEYQNVCITDMNRKYALLWNGKKWLKHKCEDIGTDMLDRCLCLISDRMDEIEKIVVDKKTLNIKKKALDKLENINSENEASDSDEDKQTTKLKAIERQKFRKKASDKIEEFLYNNRDLINTK